MSSFVSYQDTSQKDANLLPKPALSNREQVKVRNKLPYIKHNLIFV